MERDSYNRLTPIYDRLALLVLGKQHQQSKYCFLEELQQGDQVLYLGGGTGENLKAILAKIGKKGTLYYMEASKAMLRKAQSNLSAKSLERVHFLHQTQFEKLPDCSFDKIITQYLLDILTEDDLESLFAEVQKRSTESSQWLFVDFFETRERKWLLRLMIWFFRLFTQNPRKDLPDYFHYFSKWGWKAQKVKDFQKGWIKAVVFGK